MENAFFVSGIILVMELYDINSLNLNKKNIVYKTEYEWECKSWERKQGAYEKIG